MYGDSVGRIRMRILGVKGLTSSSDERGERGRGGGVTERLWGQELQPQSNDLDNPERYPPRHRHTASSGT